VRVVWLPSARRDLRNLRAYIEADRPRTARAVVLRILDATDALGAFPERGRRGQVPETRELVVPRLPYVVVYWIRGGRVEVLRVLHGAQDRP
jgi:addiction module RelE/StbE family toxin